MLPNHVIFQNINAIVTETFRDFKWRQCLKWSQMVILTMSWVSLFEPCWKTLVASSGCSRNKWQRVSSLGAKCLAAAIIQPGERSVTASMEAWSSDTQPSMALMNTCIWHVGTVKTIWLVQKKKFHLNVWPIMSIPLARPLTWSSKKAAESLVDSDGHTPISPRLRVSVSDCPACCCWRCSQTGESSLCHPLLSLRISYMSQKKQFETTPYHIYFMICSWVYTCMFVHYVYGFNSMRPRQTWHKFWFFPQAFKVHSDEPTERGSTGLFFTIQHEVVLHKHLLVWFTTKL